MAAKMPYCDMIEIKRHLKAPNSSCFLFGPRGTGKSWSTREWYPQCLRIDFLLPQVLRTYQARPEHLYEVLQATPSIQQIVIDEVQKLPTILEVVHSIIETNKSLQFILTGSNPRSLRRSGVNLLGGRAANVAMHPFMASELGSLFNLEQALQVGLVPVVATNSNPIEAREAYNALYIQEEVRQEGLVRSIEGFTRFLEVISFSQGSVINLSNVARESMIPRKTIEGYLTILEELLLAYRVPVFSKRRQRQLSVHPKFYFFDTGMYQANRPRGPLDDTDVIPGAALETLVMQNLRAWCDYTGDGHELYYWNTRGGLEVDAVVYGPLGIHAIEVKNSATIRPEMFKGLIAFAKDYPTSKCYLLYRGKERILKNGVLCLPVEEFLLGLVPGVWPE